MVLILLYANKAIETRAPTHCQLMEIALWEFKSSGADTIISVGRTSTLVGCVTSRVDNAETKSYELVERLIIDKHHLEQAI